jgi:NADH-quinone oxidoreductase subunit J
MVSLFFYILAILAVLSALGMVTARNAVHGVLFMVVNFVIIAVLYLLLDAPFVAMVQVAVYAGAIMVLFLFVVMLIGSVPTSLRDRLPGQRPLGLLAGLALILLIGSVVATGVVAGALNRGSSLAVGNPQHIGELLFTRYLYPFEITSVILLAAMVGAVVLAKKEQ